ncbi:MAG: hypothetical protein ACR2JF_17120 [Iamia sp.]
MTSSAPAEAGGTTRPCSRPLVGELALALFAYAATSVGYASWWSEVTFSQPRFDEQYHSGIYRYRLLGTELVEAVTDLVGNPLGARLGSAQSGEVFTGLVVVNGIAFVGFVALAGALLSRAGITGPRRTVLQLLTILLVTLTAYVVTPYDDLSLLWMGAVVLAAWSRPPWDALAPGFMVLGVLTRETALLAGVALVAVVLADDRSRREQQVAWSTLGAGAVAYVGLRIALGGPFQVRQAVSLDENLTTPVRWIGLAMAAVLLVAWSALTAEVVEPAESSAPRRRWFYLLSLPYLLLSAATAGWFEVRVLVPLLLADLWIRLPGTSSRPAACDQGAAST